MTALLSALVLASVFATPPSPSAPAQCSSALAQVAQVAQPSFNGGGFTSQSFCIADCGDLNAPVSCTGNTCSAVDQSQTCPAGPGSVTCDGQTTYCAACCTSGFRNVTTGPTCSCEDGASTPKDRYQCSNGLWVYQYSFCGAPFCPIWP